MHQEHRDRRKTERRTDANWKSTGRGGGSMRQENVVEQVIGKAARRSSDRLRALGVLAASVALLALVLFFPTRASAEAASDSDLPVAFAPNAGQTDEVVRYLARGAGYSFFFTDNQAVLSLAKADGQAVTGLALELEFVGTGSDARLEARAPASGTVSQLTSSSSDSASDVETYQELVYRELWPGIDMVFRGDGGELKYEFQLDPGADPAISGSTTTVRAGSRSTRTGISRSTRG
jgi:hypothetical protein